MNPTVFFADMNPFGSSAMGGTEDDTDALLGVIRSAPEGTTVVLNNAVYSVQPDALTWNRSGVVLSGGQDGMPHHLSGSKGTPKIRVLADGGFGIKVGAVSNYPSGLVFGAGLSGVSIDFNGRKFSDAGLVMEGLTRAVLSRNMLVRCGQRGSGRGSRAVRQRVVWDSLFENNLFHSLYNPGAAIIEFDARYNSDNNANCNNLRWLSNHLEQIDGKVFYAPVDSNIDALLFSFNKHEMGDSITGSSEANYVYDLSSAHRTTIERNFFNRFTAAKFASLFRIAPTGYSTFNQITRNAYSAVTCGELVNGASAAYTECFENRHDNASVAISYTNLSAHPWRYAAAASALSGFQATAP